MEQSSDTHTSKSSKVCRVRRRHASKKKDVRLNCGTQIEKVGCITVGARPASETKLRSASNSHHHVRPVAQRFGQSGSPSKVIRQFPEPESQIEQHGLDKAHLSRNWALLSPVAELRNNLRRSGTRQALERALEDLCLPAFDVDLITSTRSTRCTCRIVSTDAARTG